MSDLPRRLRQNYRHTDMKKNWPDEVIYHYELERAEAADTIEQQQAEIDRLRGVIAELAPPKPEDPDRTKDGPCCHELDEVRDGKMRWVYHGCDCMNYDDTAAAALWAREMNAWLDAQDIIARAALAQEEVKSPRQ